MVKLEIFAPSGAFGKIRDAIIGNGSGYHDNYYGYMYCSEVTKVWGAPSDDIGRGTIYSKKEIKIEVNLADNEDITIKHIYEAYPETDIMINVIHLA